MSGISLTASMRSNLLSLQNISGQVSSTQNKLSTGNKVNSAIDNPSSYYTALSLNNRADDLNALLDSMGQAVSTIKAATTALESATEFLEQAKAVANQALETAKVPDKSFFEEKVGENGAVVTTAQELRDAINAGKETICVYGAIDLGDISTSGGLTLQENQKLVGVGYFGDYDTDTNKFSSISATANTANKAVLRSIQNGNLLSDLTIKFSNMVEIGATYAVFIDGGGENNNYQTTLNNLDISLETSASQKNGATRGAIFLNNKSITNIEGKINIKVSGKLGCGIYANDAEVNANSSSHINILATGEYGHGIFIQSQATCNLKKGSEINISGSGYAAYGIYQHLSSTTNISGNVRVNMSTGFCIFNSGYSGNTCNISACAYIYLSSENKIIFCNSGGTIAKPNIIDIAAGAKLAFEKNGKTEWYEIKETYHDENTSTTISNTISADDIRDKLNVEETSAWELPEKIKEDSEEETAQDFGSNSKQYQEILNQYDSLIKDAGYKGINLLQPEKLTVKFNEENTAALEVQGKDMSSKALGFTIFDWQTQGDINKSIEELSSAINAIRNYSLELGNNYNIITTRQDFTESLINVLTEGADKLTLADMNEESANMLALQTRQQLAINSLSLASQASQSILKLF